MSDGRELALRVLRRVDRDGAFANLALDAELAAAGVIDPRDAALATELCYGVLRRRALLDRALAPLLDRALDRMEEQVLDALRVGAYQLLFLRVPVHAAVSATVESARAVGLSRASGFINAVLRRLSREGAPPTEGLDPLAAVELEGSLPRWLAERLVARLGAEEALAFARSVALPAPVALRTNRSRCTREELKARLLADGGISALDGALPDALLVEGGGSLLRTAAFREGWFSLQDEAAQAVDLLCLPGPGVTVLDACAAPGGKSCHLAELGCQVTSLDVHEKKARRIGTEAQRLGVAERVKPIAADASAPLPVKVGGPFDVVLVDAPCTGLGTLRRHPELRYRRTPEDAVRLAEGQARILDRVAAAVKPGGVLVYSVCSILEEEGPAQVEAFRARSGFLPAPVPLELPGLRDGFILELWPHRQGMDGFFAARLKRP